MNTEVNPTRAIAPGEDSLGHLKSAHLQLFMATYGLVDKLAQMIDSLEQLASRQHRNQGLLAGHTTYIK